MATIQITFAKLTAVGRIDGGSYTDRNIEIDGCDVDEVVNDPSAIEVPADLDAAGYVIVGAEHIN